jgi:hypothetical protein
MSGLLGRLCLSSSSSWRWMKRANM